MIAISFATILGKMRDDIKWSSSSSTMHGEAQPLQNTNLNSNNIQPQSHEDSSWTEINDVLNEESKAPRRKLFGSLTRKKKILIAAVVALLLLSAAGTFYRSHKHAKPGTCRKNRPKAGSATKAGNNNFAPNRSGGNFGAKQTPGKRRNDRKQP